MIQDILIIGGGIIGASISYELSKYNLKILVVEKNSFLADETSSGNSGVIHGGFDPEEHKIEAKLNILGNEIWRKEWLKNLDFPKAQVDSTIVAFNDKELKELEMLYQRGLNNGLSKDFMEIINQSELRKREPNISEEALGAFVCNTSWVIDTQKAALSLFGASQNNGVVIEKNSEVTNIELLENKNFKITINNKNIIETKNIINAAGHYADTISKMAGFNNYTLIARRGEYIVLDKKQKNLVNSILFMLPTIHGKGVIVAPMLDQNILVGPTAEENISKENTKLITRSKYEYIENIGSKIIPSIDMKRATKSFSGSRPIDKETNDFIINYAKGNNNFINAAGMQSPAIASAPAIALEIVELLKNNGTKLKMKEKINLKYKLIF